MTKTSKLAPRRGKILIALFAAIAALSAGAEALVPASAAAVISDDSCAVDYLGVCVIDSTTGGGDPDQPLSCSADPSPQAGSCSGGPLYCPPTPEPVSCTLDPPKDDPLKSPFTEGPNRSRDPWSATQSPSARNPTLWGRARREVGRQLRHRQCKKLMGDISGRIRWLYGQSFVLGHDLDGIDRVNGSGDDVLDRYQEEWDDLGCG